MYAESGRATIVITSTLLALTVGGCPGNVGQPSYAKLDVSFNVTEPATVVASTGQPIFEAGVIFDRLQGRIGHHAPTITTLPDDSLLAAWYSYVGSDELGGAAIYTARRPADAQAWIAPQLHIDRPEADGNPVLYSEGTDVWLFQAVVPGTGWSTAHIEVQRSSDNGATWTSPKTIIGPLGSNVRFPPVRLDDGTLLLPAYDDLLQRSLFFASSDGDSWSLRSSFATSVSARNIQPSMMQLAGGRLLTVMRNTARGWLWVAASDDRGQTWSEPFDAGFPNPASPSALLLLSDGNLVLVYNNSNAARRPLAITISADDGRTWYPSRTLVDGDGAYSYPAAVQAADGLIHIVYSHDREFIGHIVVNAAWIAGVGI